MTVTVKFLLIGKADSTKFTVQNFDSETFLILKRRPHFNFVREQVRETVTYTISDGDGELGHFAISPGTDLSPHTQLEICSYATDTIIVASWPLFHSCPHAVKVVVDDRETSFRDLCQWIFTEFTMQHGLDMAGKPTNVWDYLHQEDAASGSDGDVIIVLPKGFPKKPETIARHKRFYQHCLELRAIYREKYDEGDTDDWKPKLGDYRDFITERTGTQLSKRRIYDIVKRGDAGIYDHFP